MQTNQYEEIEKHYQKTIFCVFLSLLHKKKTRKWMQSTLYWETKGHCEKKTQKLVYMEIFPRYQNAEIHE